MFQKGRVVWLSAELLNKLYYGESPLIPIEDLLRGLVGIDIKVPQPPREKSTRPKNWRYDVSELDIDGSRVFPRDTDTYAMWRSICNYSRKTEKRFTRVVTLQGIQVIRIK